MSVRRNSQNWDQPQPNDLRSYSDDIFCGSELQLSGTHEERISPPTVAFDEFLGCYHEDLQQKLVPEVDDEARYLESCAASMRQSFVSTPIEFLEPGETPSESSATNWQSGCGSEEDDVGSSMQVDEPQFESPTPSTSMSTAGVRKQKKSKPRKKEENGICSRCEKEFGRISDFKRHETAVHKKSVHVCMVCKVPCSRKDALQRHIRDRHKTKARSIQTLTDNHIELETSDSQA